MKESRVVGLYKRESYEEKEFLCLKDDPTYHYFLKRNNLEETLTEGMWHFDNLSGKSYVGLSNFNYSIGLKKYLIDTSGIGVPVKYSYKTL